MAETIKITDDRTSRVEVLKALIEEQVTETKVNYDGTINDLTTDISRVDGQIATLNARKAELENWKTKIQTELNKLPARVVPEEE